MASIVQWRGWLVVSCLFAALVAAYMTFFALTRPAWAWDMIPYTVAALKSASSDFARVHAEAYALVKAHVPANVFADLTGSAGTRATMHGNPAALASYLPLWECKVGYVLLLKAVALVADPIVAMMAVSLASALGILAILLWQSLRLPGLAALSWLPLAMLFGLPGLASMLSPDPITTFIYLVGFTALLSAKWRLASALLVAAVLFRPDGVVLNAVVGILMARQAPREAAFVVLGSLAGYLLDVTLSGHVGWWTQLYLSFVTPPSDLIDFRPEFRLSIYLGVLARSIEEMLHNSWVFATAAIIILAAMILDRRPDRPAEALLIALVAGMALRFVAYPSTEIRHYAPALFGTCLILLRAAEAYAADRR